MCVERRGGGGEEDEEEEGGGGGGGEVEGCIPVVERGDNWERVWEVVSPLSREAGKPRHYREYNGLESTLHWTLKALCSVVYTRNHYNVG